MKKKRNKTKASTSEQVRKAAYARWEGKRKSTQLFADFFPLKSNLLPLPDDLSKEQ
jgi:hypothetical protein